MLHIFHDWTTWTNGGVFGYTLYQFRFCGICNKQQQRKVGWGLRK